MFVQELFSYFTFIDMYCIKKNTTTVLKKMARGKCTIFDLATLKEATENFSEKHKLGEGGFGTVYKVLLCKQNEE